MDNNYIEQRHVGGSGSKIVQIENLHIFVIFLSFGEHKCYHLNNECQNSLTMGVL